MNYKIVFFICILFLCTATMAQENEIPIELPVEISRVETYFQENSILTDFIRPGTNFPLPLLTINDLQLPQQYASYELRIVDFYIPSKRNFVAINYEYQKPGSIAYAVQHGSHYKYSVSILYEVAPQSICMTEDIESQLEHFQSEDGVYVLRVDAEVVPISQYFSENCETSGFSREATLSGVTAFLLVLSGIGWRMLHRRSKLKRNSKQ